MPLKLVHDGKTEAANEGTALWRRPKSELTEEDYLGFYRHLGNIFDKPWATMHWRAEGALEYTALLFIPDSKPFDPVEGDRKSKLRLHVRRMFITDEAELLPPWLRFVQGVVDTEDLPLNVSREMLQTTPLMARMRKAIVNRVLTELKTRAKTPPAAAAPTTEESEDAQKADANGYLSFWENFGSVLKEGLWEDGAARADIAPLLRFRSSTETGWTSFDDYVSRMKPDQPAIYLLAGEDIESLRGAAVLEGFSQSAVTRFCCCRTLSMRFGPSDSGPMPTSLSGMLVRRGPISGRRKSRTRRLRHSSRRSRPSWATRFPRFGRLRTSARAR